MERPCPCTVKDLSSTNLISIGVDALMQHRFERRYDGQAVSNRFADTRLQLKFEIRSKLLISLVSALGIEPRTP
jgi:hypothetical protein